MLQRGLWMRHCHILDSKESNFFKQNVAIWTELCPDWILIFRLWSSNISTNLWFVCLFTQVGPWGTHANPWKIRDCFPSSYKCTSLNSQYRLIKMHAGPDSFDKQSKKWKKIARKRRKERRPLPTTLYNFTLNPYFVRRKLKFQSQALMQRLYLGVIFKALEN